MKILNTQDFISERTKIKPVTNNEFEDLYGKYGKCRYFPKTKEELRHIIAERMEKEGNECDLNDIYTGNVTDMSWLFSATDKKYNYFKTEDLSDFAGDISKWDVSNVTDMSGMFHRAGNFNSDISGWDVSKVKTMYDMFSAATNFNCDISNWNVSNVTNMGNMFSGARSFNQPIGSWDVHNVGCMRFMFSSATHFNQPIGSWNVSNVESMYSMFSFADIFNQDISGWDTSKVLDLGYNCFYHCPIKEENKPTFNENVNTSNKETYDLIKKYCWN